MVKEDSRLGRTHGDYVELLEVELFPGMTERLRIMRELLLILVGVGEITEVEASRRMERVLEAAAVFDVVLGEAELRCANDAGTRLGPMMKLASYNHQANNGSPNQ